MTDVAKLRADLEALKATRRSGVQRVVMADREVTFQSGADLDAAIGAIEQELSGGIAPRNIVVRSNKGWQT